MQSKLTIYSTQHVIEINTVSCLPILSTFHELAHNIQLPCLHHLYPDRSKPPTHRSMLVRVRTENAHTQTEGNTLIEADK